MTLKIKIIARLHYRYGWPLLIPELLAIIPESWKLQPCCQIYDSPISWRNARHNPRLVHLILTPIL